MRSGMALPLLLAFAVATGVRGQFSFNNLRKFDPSKVADLPIIKKTPEQLAKAVADSAEKAIPHDLSGKIEEALNGSSVSEVAEDAQKAAMGKIGETLHDITGKDNVSQAVRAAKPAQHKLSDALARAGEALHRGADAIVNASTATVEGSLEEAASSVNATGAFDDVKDALEKASPKDVADELRKVTPQVAKAINQTSRDFASQLAAVSPKATALVNRTGHQMADKIARTKPLPEDPVEPDPAADSGAFGLGQSWVGLSGVLLLVLTVVAGYLVSLRFKTSQRSPMLLSDALDTVRPGGGARNARNVEMMNQEPFFSQF